MENFIPAYLRTVNQETVFQKALRTICLLEGKAQLPKFLDKGLYIK